MAKITHNNYIDTVNDIVNESRDRKVTHLTYDSDNWDGKYMHIENQTLLNFGTCGYLGLEIDPRLIDKACEYTRNYGTQFSISRAFVASQQVHNLEDNLSQIFNRLRTLVFSSTTLAHISVLPIVVDPEDSIILDQQVHFSVQNAAQLMVPRGTKVQMIRHNNMDMLERALIKMRDVHSKIWYMVDGVYSMYGDIAPIEKINLLMDKYPQLHLYADDAHGVGWSGVKGCGAVFSDVKHKDRMILISTLAKGFGATGGIAVFPNELTYLKVQTFGGPLGYSHPIAPSVLGASIAASEIMLSGELLLKQEELNAKIEYCNTLLAQTNLPVLSSPETPIYFIGSGQPNVGYNLNKRLLNDGFYVNLAVFPAVSMNNTGLRFTITQHVSKENIYSLIEAISYHYPLALKEENKDWNDVLKAFKLPLLDQNTRVLEEITNKVIPLKLSTQVHCSIKHVDSSLWDGLWKDEGHYNHNSMLMFEKAFTNNVWEEHNWEFYYIVVKDELDELVAITYFTAGLIKDDLFSYPEISEEIEVQREEDRYCLTSKALVMGSMISEGDHLHYNTDHGQYKEALEMILDQVSLIQVREDINTVIMRDFSPGQEELEKLFHDYGYSRFQMPNSNTIPNVSDKVELDFISTLSKRSRRHVRGEVVKNMDLFSFSTVDSLTKKQTELFYSMYLEVSRRNMAVNSFEYPKSVFEEMSNEKNWEFSILTLNEIATDDVNNGIVAIGCCYANDGNYTPLLLGLDYQKNFEFNVYKQFLFQIANNARERGFKKVFFGYTADVEKKKLGAEQNPKFAYANVQDNFNQEIISQISR
jgi:7-keto-8-aminopelargonate synthetase-like enzyme